MVFTFQHSRNFKVYCRHTKRKKGNSPHIIMLFGRVVTILVWLNILSFLFGTIVLRNLYGYSSGDQSARQKWGIPSIPSSYANSLILETFLTVDILYKIGTCHTFPFYRWYMIGPYARPTRCVLNCMISCILLELAWMTTCCVACFFFILCYLSCCKNSCFRNLSVPPTLVRTRGQINPLLLHFVWTRYQGNTLQLLIPINQSVSV